MSALTYRKYRNGIGIEYKSEEHIWHGSNLREVKAHARGLGASAITIIDTVGHIQRPRVLHLELGVRS